MRVLVLGTADDARGFALAGARAIVPQGRREVAAALARASEEQPPVGLVLVSAEVAALAEDAVRAFAARAGSPPILVLPGAGGGAHEGAR
jgi:vacuolar-type H+-ATPase subunit F/Vma7